MFRRKTVTHLSLRFAACAVVALVSVLLSTDSSHAQRLKYTLSLPGTPQYSSFYGASEAMGDVNGDGKADIAVGSSKETVNVNGVDNLEQGRAYVYSGASGATLYTLNIPTADAQVDAEFGYGIAIGDVNGDGKADIAIGAFGKDVTVGIDTYSSEGRVYVFSGATGSVLYTLDLPTSDAQANADFGFSVAMGDVNGDGKADIIVGAYGYKVGSNTDQGRVYVFSGLDGTLLVTNFSNPLGIPDAQANADFGYSVAVGDVNGDGKADIAVGAPGLNSGQGKAYVFSGATGALLSPLSTSNPVASGSFGYAVALGDVNGDGKADITVGAPKETVTNANQGRAYVFSGADYSPLPYSPLTTPNPETNPGRASFFGISAALGDVNGDGKADIAVGAGNETVGSNGGQGRAYVFSGSAGALLYGLTTPELHRTPCSPTPCPNSNTGAYFGYAVALGDVDGDGKADLAAGNWNYSPSLSFPSPGQVHVWTGSCVYDLNNDGKVSFADLLIFSAAFHSTAATQSAFDSSNPNPPWNPAADFNANGQVDATDQALFQAHYGQNPCVP